MSIIRFNALQRVSNRDIVKISDVEKRSSLFGNNVFATVLVSSVSIAPSPGDSTVNAIDDGTDKSTDDDGNEECESALEAHGGFLV